MGLLDDAIREHLDLKRRRGADPTEIERAEREALGPVRREPSMSATYADEGVPAAIADAPAEDFIFAAEVGEFAGEAPTTVTPPDDESAPAIAAADHDDPTFDELTATEPPGVAGLELKPMVSGPEAEPMFEPVPESEPRPKRRHLFGRHRHDEDGRALGNQELAAQDTFSDVEPRGADRVAGADSETVGRAQPVSRDEQVQPVVTPPPTLRITPDSEPGNTIEYDVEQAFLEEDETEPVQGEDILEETPDFLADTPDHDRLWFEQKPPPDFDFDS